MNWTIEHELMHELFESARFKISDILPSEWAEINRFMTSDVSRMEGPYSFDNAPYVREIVDFLSPTCAAKFLALMKGAQLGLSTGFSENGTGWIISQNPGPILYLVGHDDLVEKAMNKIENMIDTTGIRPLIRSNANKTKNNKSGDKDRSKEFSGGFMTLGSTNHKTLRQVSYRYGFIDDFESMRGASKESGGTVPMIKQRFSTYKDIMKLAFISTPELKENSNIEPEYLKGDQRKYFMPCPCCGEQINFEWEIASKVDEGKKAGITWKLDENDELISESVGYTCQECDGFFTDQNKSAMLLKGKWIPTVKPKDPEYISYHLSSLYGPTYMFGWEQYVRQYLEANPIGQPRDERLHQTFVNLVLGETYEPTGETISSDSLQNNQRPYAIGIIPEKQSIADGNGKIIMVTIGADCNGTVLDEKFKHKEDDARLDWEIVAWSETGATYSVSHGSIGTFQHSAQRDEGFHNHPDRVKWSYKKGHEFCVWDKFEEIISTEIPCDTGGSRKVLAGALDTAPYTTYSYPFIENTVRPIYGVKGDKDHEIGILVEGDHIMFKKSRENPNLWILNVNKYKDNLSNYAGLIWETAKNKKQPENFMNFPQSDGASYTDRDYFKHYESEKRIVDEKTRKLVWTKKSAGIQNHMWDCRIYNIAARDIYLSKFFSAVKVKDGTFADYVRLIMG